MNVVLKVDLHGYHGPTNVSGTNCLKLIMSMSELNSYQNIRQHVRAGRVVFKFSQGPFNHYTNRFLLSDKYNRNWYPLLIDNRSRHIFLKRRCYIHRPQRKKPSLFVLP